MNDYKIIAMIPARLGSKRIVKKNIRYLHDKPLIQYPIELVMHCDAFESVWVNTESRELGAFAEEMGVNFHKRPVHLAVDTATNREFTYEFLQKHDCDYVVMINSTSPLLRAETLTRFITFLREGDFDTIMSVVPLYAECFYRCNPVNFEPDKPKVLSQFLEPIEEIVWALTAWRRETFIKLQEEGQSPIFAGKLGLFTIPKDEAVDLDAEEDWNIAEGMIQSRLNKPEARWLF